LFCDTHMAVYFTDRVLPISNDDVHHIDCALIGNFLHIIGVGTFVLDALVGGVRHSSQLLELVQSDSRLPMFAFCEGSTFSPSLMQFPLTVSAGSVPLYLLVWMFVFHTMMFVLNGTNYMQYTSVALSFRLQLEATFAKLWNRVGVGTMALWGGSIFR
jgi:hypothetical protein